MTKVNIDMENRTHEFQVQIQELKGELETLHKAPNKVSQINYMDNPLKEFDALFLDNILFKVQNKHWLIKTRNGRNGGKQCRRL